MLHAFVSLCASTVNAFQHLLLLWTLCLCSAVSKTKSKRYQEPTPRPLAEESTPSDHIFGARANAGSAADNVEDEEHDDRDEEQMDGNEGLRSGVGSYGRWGDGPHSEGEDGSAGEGVFALTLYA